MNEQTIEQTEQEIVEDFELFDNQVGKYELLIDIGHRLPEMPETLKQDSNLIEGCTSMVWVYAKEKNGRIYFQADSNTVITKGIIALLLKVLNGRKAEDIVNAQLGFLE